MSGDTDKAKISDNQDEDKKSGSAAGDGQTTEDESSQDSKGESLNPTEATNEPKNEVQGNANVDPPGPTKNEDEKTEGDVKEATSNGKAAAADVTEDDKDDKPDTSKKEENGETNEDEDVKENNKADSKPAAKKKAKKEDTEEEEDDEEEAEEEEEDEGESADEPKKKEKKEKKAKDDEEEEEEGGEEEEEEDEEEEAPKPKPKKEPSEPPVPVPAGKGIPLGHIGNVEISLSRFKTNDQKMLHQYLYGQLCLDRNVKRNVKKFKGYEWAAGSAEYKAKLEETAKMEVKQLRTMCEMLDLEKKGPASDMAARIVGFLQQPSAQSPHARGSARAAPAPAPAAPGGRPRRSAAVLQHRGYSDEEYETDPETKIKGPKVAKDGSEDSDGSFNPSGSEEADSDFEPEAGDAPTSTGAARKRRGRQRSSGKPAKRGRKPKGKGGKGAAKKTRGKRARSESEDESDKSESDSEAESGSDAEDSDEPKSKRGRPGPVAKGRKAAVTKNAKATPVKRKAPTPPAKKKPAARGKPPAKKGKKSSDESEGSEEESEEGSEDESDGDKKGKRPPTDDEIRKYVKQILEGANLEEITMKTVCKQVYSHYPDFDLAHKKDFIKATVKSCI